VKSILNLKRSVLAALTFAVVLGLGFHVREMSARAQAAGVASTPEAQSPEKNEQEKDENDAYLHSPMVVKLGGMMGMNAEQSATVFEVTNFVLFAGAVLWVIAKLVPKQIRDRNTAIQKHLVDARTATQEASARLNSVEERLGKLDGQIAGLRAQAEQDSARDEVRIKAAVEDEKKKIVAAAEQEIASATAQAQKQLQHYAAELAIEQAARKLVVSAETDRLLVQRFAERLAGDGSKKGQN
jgi:F-type H+-transporting ATPase subunit b